ncbi:MAG: hypothetical protein JXB32_22530 [Deltaproteobacteria bacterium]|nr:hypothetical protein [Deltaproteobacteria bacterium]
MAAERPCELRWTVASAPDRTLLDGALAGGVAALLYGVGEGFVLLMAAGDPPEMLAVSLPGWPDPSGPAEGSPAGAVASYGDRFLVAYGPAGPERVVLRLRAVTAVRGRLIPVNAPGAPGSDGAPVLELPAPTPEARPTVLLHAYSRGVVLGAGFLEAEPAVGTAVVRTPTGAPAAEDVFAWRLAVESGGPGGGRWRLESPAGPELVRYVGPLGGTALGMTAAGTPVLVPAPPRRAPFAFADGWVPAPGEAIRFGNERLVREEPRAGGGLLAVVYDVRGRVTARLALPSGTRPLAVSRAPDELLVLGPDGEPGLCIADQPPRLPTRLDPRGVLASPTTGSGSCGR